jgi:voltage-gated potassium channel
MMQGNNFTLASEPDTMSKSHRDYFFLRSVIDFIKDKHYRDLLIISTVILIVGTFVYHHLEGWSYLDSFYFSVVTLTTIGFGDFYPHTDEGKLFTVIYIVVGLGMILGFINAVFEHYSSRSAMRRRFLMEKRDKQLSGD